MRPIKGFVSEKRGQSLTIKLETGRTVQRTSTDRRIGLGEHVWIMLNYSTGEYGDLFYHDPCGTVGDGDMKEGECLSEEEIEGMLSDDSDDDEQLSLWYDPEEEDDASDDIEDEPIDGDDLDEYDFDDEEYDIPGYWLY
jgi:hypothetical protein